MGDTRIMQALHIGDKVYEKNQNEPWSITKVIGFGGSSIVYEAKHPKYGTFVLKECFPCDGNGLHFTRREGVACAIEAGPEALEEMKALFTKEWEVSKELGESRSGRILEIYGLMDVEAIEIGGKRYQTYGQSCFLRMESLSSQKADADGYGVFLEEIMEDDKDIYLITNIVLQTLRALEVVHKKGYIHGDIQHRNIYFRDYHQEKKEVEFSLLIDFGTARKLVDGRVVDATSFFSTNGYTAPEIRSGKNVDTRADIYSVGCLLYFLLTGEYWTNPYGGDAGVGNRILDAVGCPEIAKRMVNDIVKKALKEEPEERYLNATEMLGAMVELQELLQSVNVSGERLLIQERAKRQVRPYSECYIRRDDLMDRLNGKLSEENQGKNYCFLYGVGGEGKSELARAYADEQKKSGCYQQVFWLTYKPEYGSVGELFRENGYTMAVQETIDCFEEDTLIVVDNYVVVDNYAAMEDGTGSIVEMVKRETGKAHVIFTTRRTPVMEEEHSLLVESENRKKFALQVFQGNFIKACRGRGKLPEESMPDVERIVELTGYNPMMATLLAKEIGIYGEPRRVRNVSWYDAIHRFRKSLEESILESYKTGARVPYKKDEGDEINRELEVSELMQLLFRDVLSLQDISKFESQVLTILCEFSAQYVDRLYLETILGDNEEQCEIYAAINKLEERGFVRIDDSDGWKISMHPLLCEVFKKLDKMVLLREEKEALFKHVLENWLVLEEEERNEQYNLMYNLWKMIEKDLEPECNLLVSSLLHIKQSERFYKECYPNSDAGMIASVLYQDGVKFFVYDFTQEREILIADLQTRKVYDRYYGDSDDVEETTNAGKEVKLEAAITIHDNVVLKFPDTMNGIFIENIPSVFFRNNKNVREISFPVELKKIGDWAFEKCSGLTGDLSIPQGVKEIGEGAFFGCSGFNGKLVIPEGITAIEGWVFGECSGLTGDLIIPNGVTTIGQTAFYGCSGMTGKLVIPEGVTEIGEFAFASCSGLTGELVIPEGVMKIGEGIFSDCSGLTGDLIIPKGVIKIARCSFSGCSGLTGELVIPEGVKKIEAYAFEGCSGLTGDLIIPKGVTSIGRNAFYGCSGLTGDMSTLEGVKKIGKEAFGGCLRLTNKNSLLHTQTVEQDEFEWRSRLRGKLIIPKDITEIEEFFFCGCSRLTGDLVIPEGVTKIGTSAFEGCKSLNGELKIPECVKEIGDRAFFGCSGLRGNLILPKGITRIGDRAFEGCNGLSGELIIPEGVKEIGKGAFCDCNGLNDKLLIPNGVMKIGVAAFFRCGGLRGNLVIPKGIKEIEEFAFSFCKGLTGDLVIPEGVTKIGGYAFWDCSSLTGNLVIPEGVKEIGDCAFRGCSNLQEKLELPESVENIGYMAFYDGNYDRIVIKNSKTELKNNFIGQPFPILVCKHNSTAEFYAKKNNIPIEYLEG